MTTLAPPAPPTPSAPLQPKGKGWSTQEKGYISNVLKEGHTVAQIAAAIPWRTPEAVKTQVQRMLASVRKDELLQAQLVRDAPALAQPRKRKMTSKSMPSPPPPASLFKICFAFLIKYLVMEVLNKSSRNKGAEKEVQDAIDDAFEDEVEDFVVEPPSPPTVVPPRSYSPEPPQDISKSNTSFWVVYRPEIKATIIVVYRTADMNVKVERTGLYSIAIETATSLTPAQIEILVTSVGLPADYLKHHFTKQVATRHFNFPHRIHNYIAVKHDAANMVVIKVSAPPEEKALEL